jgi:hypothetical protein
MTMASDVFKARYRGVEWWAREVDAIAPDLRRAHLWPRVAEVPPHDAMGPSLVVPFDDVERVEDIPPEPRDARVLYDRDDTPWMRNESLGRWVSRHSAESYRTLVRDRGPLHPYPRAARAEIERLTAERDEATAEVTAESTRFAEVERLLRVAQEQLADARNAGTDIAEERDVATAEIERLTVHLKAKDAHAVEMATQIKRLRAERDAAQSAHGQACAAADELQRRIDRAIRQLEGFGRDFSVRALAILRGEVDQ